MKTAAQDYAETLGDDGTQPSLYVVAKPANGSSGIDSSLGITPEVIAVIQTAATAFVGKPIRILSVRLLSATEHDSSSWAGQGRDIIQASHNLVQRSRL